MLLPMTAMRGLRSLFTPDPLISARRRPRATAPAARDNSAEDHTHGDAQRSHNLRIVALNLATI